MLNVLFKANMAALGKHVAVIPPRVVKWIVVHVASAMGAMEEEHHSEAHASVGHSWKDNLMAEYQMAHAHAHKTFVTVRTNPLIVLVAPLPRRSCFDAQKYPRPRFQ